MLAVAAEISAADGIVPIDFLEDHLIGVWAVKNHGSFRAEFNGCIEHGPRRGASQEHALMSFAGLWLKNSAMLGEEGNDGRNAARNAASEFKATAGDEDDFDARLGGTQDRGHVGFATLALAIEQGAVNIHGDQSDGQLGIPFPGAVNPLSRIGAERRTREA